ncbi:MAG: 2-C-methyl-D-erythritol 4-phosphate cytidylyltransferase [Thermotogaceae bacterium]|nr:2-C-methyl-D-erythritol 4-phosphate cytidylyltransferase [Thermotogaceae bacterium]
MIVGIIMAAGLGTRVGTSIPKQFVKLCNKEVFLYSLDSFEMCDAIDACLILVPQGWKEHVEQATSEYSKVQWILEGGRTRHDSSLIALEFLKDFKVQIVVFHDASRPFLQVSLLSRVANEAKVSGAVTTAVPSHDTLAFVEKGKIAGYAEREKLWRIQTPQAFKFERAFRYFKEFSGTDGTQPFVEAGQSVVKIDGDPLCFKITDFSDLMIANLICSHWDAVLGFIS